MLDFGGCYWCCWCCWGLGAIDLCFFFLVISFWLVQNKKKIKPNLLSIPSFPSPLLSSFLPPLISIISTHSPFFFSSSTPFLLLPKFLKEMSAHLLLFFFFIYSLFLFLSFPFHPHYRRGVSSIIILSLEKKIIFLSELIFILF